MPSRDGFATLRQFTLLTSLSGSCSPGQLTRRAIRGLLRPLNHEYHHECDDAGEGVDKELPAIGVMKIGPLTSHPITSAIAQANAELRPVQLVAAVVKRSRSPED